MVDIHDKYFYIHISWYLNDHIVNLLREIEPFNFFLSIYKICMFSVEPHAFNPLDMITTDK